MIARLSSVALIAVLASCTEQVVDLGGDYRVAASVPPIGSRELDILFVVDSSGSIADNLGEVAAHAQAALFDILDGAIEGTPNVHLGVTTTDLGAAGVDIGDASCVGTGDGGSFTRAAGQCLRGPDASFLRDLDDGAGGRDRNFDGTIAEAFGCMIGRTTGGIGCGFEQPLGAAVAAISGANPGFLRPDALLAVVIISDEDDCSASPSFFEQLVASGQPLSGFACARSGIVCDEDLDTPGEKHNCQATSTNGLQVPQDLVDALVAAKGGDPSRVILATIAGPTEPTAVQLYELGAPGGTLGMAASCVHPTTGGEAAPALRLTSALAHLPGRAWFESLCEEVPQTLAAVSNRIADVAGRRTCLRGTVRDLDADAAGVQPQCRVQVGLDPWRAPSAMVEVVACDATTTTTCYRLVADAVTCGAADSSLRVEIDGLDTAGQHVVVSCLAP